LIVACSREGNEGKGRLHGGELFEGVQTRERYCKDDDTVRWRNERQKVTIRKIDATVPAKEPSIPFFLSPTSLLTPSLPLSPRSLQEAA